jgi:SAM-dependent methyltransferase
MQNKEYSKNYFNKINHKKQSNMKKLGLNILESTPLFSKYYFYFLKILRNLPKNAKVLDIGCAQGSTLNFIHNIRPDLELYGTDLSDVKKLLPKYVKFIKADITKDKLKEKNFDFIISRHLIEHLNVSDVPKVFEKSYNLLKNGGILFVLCPRLSNSFYRDPTHIRPYNKESLRRLFEMSNFKKIKSFNSYEFNIPFNIILRKKMKLCFGFAKK